MKPNKTSLTRLFKVSATAVFGRKPYRTLLFASVCNGHCIHLRHRIDARLFSVQRQESWPTKAVITHTTPKRFWRVRDIYQRAACRKTLSRPTTVTNQHTIQTKGD